MITLIIDAPTSQPPFPLRCDCPTCGREGCSGDCDWSGPPAEQSGDHSPVSPGYSSDDSDGANASGGGDAYGGTGLYEQRVDEAILGVMDGDD